MRIGIISDVHGDLQQLEVAIALLHKEGVDQIICAGDLVDFGVDSIGVVNRIFERGIPCIAGNHDRAARANQRLRQRQLEQGVSVQFLDEITLNRLDALPRTMGFEWEGKSVLMAHANPWSDDSLYVYPDSSPVLHHRVVKEAQADVVILGHTHEPMCIGLDEGMIINPGSVSANYSLLFGTCGLLSIPDMNFRVLSLVTGAEIVL